MEQVKTWLGRNRNRAIVIGVVVIGIVLVAIAGG